VVDFERFYKVIRCHFGWFWALLKIFDIYIYIEIYIDPKTAINLLYLEKYELATQTSANEKGILVKILSTFGQKKFSVARDIGPYFFQKQNFGSSDRQSDT